MDGLRKWQSRWRGVYMKCTDRSHKYFRCPACGQPLRVPRGAGKIWVSCRACGAGFEQHS